jgi:hypothetical protein
MCQGESQALSVRPTANEPRHQSCGLNRRPVGWPGMRSVSTSDVVGTAYFRRCNESLASIDGTEKGRPSGALDLASSLDAGIAAQALSIGVDHRAFYVSRPTTNRRLARRQMVNRFGRGRLGCVGGLVLAAAMWGVIWAYDVFIGAPWAYSVGGRPTLTGDWAGGFDKPGGQGGAVSLEIIRGSGVRRRGTPQMLDYTRIGGHPELHGTAVWCRSDGSVSQYRVRGFANSSGDVTIVFNVTVVPTRTSNELHETRGHWSGGVLTLAGPLRLYTVAPGRSTSTRALTDSTRMTLHPASGGPAAASCGPAGTRP